MGVWAGVRWTVGAACARRGGPYMKKGKETGKESKGAREAGTIDRRCCRWTMTIATLGWTGQSSALGLDATTAQILCSRYYGVVQYGPKG